MPRECLAHQMPMTSTTRHGAHEVVPEAQTPVREDCRRLSNSIADDLPTALLMTP